MFIELVSLKTIQEIAHEYGYGAVFIGILLENTGIPIPGETITLVAGFLAGSGDLDYGLVLISAIAGAVLGDNFGYWIGAYGGWKLLTRLGKLFRIPESQLIDIREKFSQNAAKAVFLGRFVALFRIFAGPLAGIAQMPYPRFFFYNFAGAVVWAGATVTFAYFVGRIAPLEQLISWVAQFGLFALLLLGAAIVIPLLWERRVQLSEAIEPQDLPVPRPPTASQPIQTKHSDV